MEAMVGRFKSIPPAMASDPNEADSTLLPASPRVLVDFTMNSACLSNAALANPRVRAAGVRDGDDHDDLVGARRVGDDDRDRVEVVAGPDVALVGQRHVERRAGAADLDVGRDDRLAAADRVAHRLAETRV